MIALRAAAANPNGCLLGLVHHDELSISKRWIAGATDAAPLVDHHTKTDARLVSPLQAQVFIDVHGFLLIIRGFVKVAVNNAGVIPNENIRD